MGHRALAVPPGVTPVFQHAALHMARCRCGSIRTAPSDFSWQLPKALGRGDLCPPEYIADL